MFCANCGNENPDGVQFCSNCGASLTGGEVPVYQAQPPVKINNHLVEAILTTVCCCLPFGIVAIVYAAGVNGKVAAGDIEGAKKSAHLAGVWAVVAVCSWLFVVLAEIVLALLLPATTGCAASPDAIF